MKAISIVAAAALLIPLGAVAQEATSPGRFHLERMEGGVVRLDTQTGAMSLCHEKEGNLVCRMAADERAAFERELELLTMRVEALEKAAAAAPADAKPRFPTDEEIDRTMSVMERMMQRFMGIVKNLDGGEEETTPGTDAMPQKT